MAELTWRDRITAKLQQELEERYVGGEMPTLVERLRIEKEVAERANDLTGWNAFYATIIERPLNRLQVILWPSEHPEC